MTPDTPHERDESIREILNLAQQGVPIDENTHFDTIEELVSWLEAIEAFDTMIDWLSID